jgi:hypothetical protein
VHGKLIQSGFKGAADFRENVVSVGDADEVPERLLPFARKS